MNPQMMEGDVEQHSSNLQAPMIVPICPPGSSFASDGDEDNGVDAYADSSADLPGFGQSNTINIEDPCFDQKLRRQKLLNLQWSVESLARTPMRPMQQ
jgi:hypothetical protein